MQLRVSIAAGVVGLVACAPAMDWREVRPEGGGIVVLMPCRPASHARTVAIASAQIKLTLYACTAGGVTWALALADASDPQRVGAVLRALREAAQANVAAKSARPIAWRMEGATPNAEAVRFEIDGRLPDGKSIQEQGAVFAKGTFVYQVTTLGERLDSDALDTFFGGIRLPD